MLKEYLKTSPIAETVKLDGNVILHRQKMSTEELIGLKSDGEFTVPGRGDDEYELELNGLTVATGKIVRKGGEFFFKVIKMHKGDES